MSKHNYFSHLLYMSTTRRNSMLAKNYVDDIEVIRKRLRVERDKYKLAEYRNDVSAMDYHKSQFDERWKKHWPYYDTGGARIADGAPRPANALPYPSDHVLNKLSSKKKWEIMATALLARRGVDKRTRLEGFLPKVNAVVDRAMFKQQLIRYINPPGYRNNTWEDEDEDWDGEWAGDVGNFVPAPIYPPIQRVRRRRSYDISPNLALLPNYGEGPAPAYSPERIPSAPPLYSSQNYHLEVGGRKTRRHRQSTRKHKRTSKHKQSTRKHKRTSKHKRSKTYKK